MVSIGKIRLKYGLMLAPMAGVADAPFRRVCIENGAEYSVSEMVSAKAIHFADRHTSVLYKVTPPLRPMAVQIFGSEPDIMAEAAAFLASLPEPPDAIDINMGCPVKKIVSNGEGSALMKKPELAADIVKAVKTACSLPVTVKIRTGWDSRNINAPALAEKLEKAGADMITVHGRTREQFYAPPVDLDVIKEVKRAVSVPVIGNGGIESPADAMRMLEYTGCDGIMIGRAAMGNPWIFSEIKCAFDGTSFFPPSRNLILETALRHLDMLIDEKGERTGIAEARRQMSYYLKGFDGASKARGQLNQAMCREDVVSVLIGCLGSSDCR